MYFFILKASILLIIAQISMAYQPEYMYYYKTAKADVKQLLRDGDCAIAALEELLNTYTGSKADTCMEPLMKKAKNILHRKIQDFIETIQEIDLEIESDVSLCYGDKFCEKEAFSTGKSKLETTKTERTDYIKRYKADYLESMKKGMDQCMDSV